MPTATKAVVRINSIHVLYSSVTTTSEPGSHAEWFMTFVVNGQSALWSNENVVDDTIYTVNREFIVDLTSNQTIFIKASGYEEDDTSANDVLPTAEITLNPAQDFQLGGTFSFASGESGEGSYTVQVSVFPAAQQGLTAAREYAGVYTQGNGGHGLWSTTWQAFTRKWDEWSKAGLRLLRLSTFRQDTGQVSFGDTTQRMFVGTFRAGTGGYALYAAEFDAFRANWEQASAQGLRLVDVAVYLDGTKRMYAGVYRAGGGGHGLWFAEWPSFQAKWQEWSDKGLRLVAVDSYLTGAGKRVFAGVYRAGTDKHALIHGLEWNAFRKKTLELKAKGLRLVDLGAYPSGGNQLYLGCYRAGRGAQALVKDTWTDFTNDWQTRSQNGMRLMSLDTHAGASEE
jgi:hypothetical protein